MTALNLIIIKPFYRYISDPKMHCTSLVLFVNFNEQRLRFLVLLLIASGILVNEIYLLLSPARSVLFSV